MTTTNPLGSLRIDSEEAPVAPDRTALLVIDMVHCQVTPGEGMMRQMGEFGIDTTYLVERVEKQVIPNTARLTAAFRNAGAKVVYLRVGGLDPDLRDTLPGGREVLQLWGAGDGLRGSEVIERLAPQPGDLSIVKLGSGGFTTSNLDQHLRFMGIDTVFYTGVLTNVCVLLTMASGFDLAYDGFLVADATAALNNEIQSATELIVGGLLGEIVTTAQALELMGAGSLSTTRS